MRVLPVTIIAFLWLSASSAVLAVSGTLTLDQPQPIHHGDAVTFTATIEGTTKGSTWEIWVRCEQPEMGGTQVYSVRQPFGSTFVLDSPTWDPTMQAVCDDLIVYSVYYGQGKVRHNYLAEQGFIVYP